MLPSPIPLPPSPSLRARRQDAAVFVVALGRGLSLEQADDLVAKMQAARLALESGLVATVAVKELAHVSA
jgi:hypothetical protein